MTYLVRAENKRMANKGNVAAVSSHEQLQIGQSNSVLQVMQQQKAKPVATNQITNSSSK